MTTQTKARWCFTKTIRRGGIISCGYEFQKIYYHDLNLVFAYVKRGPGLVWVKSETLLYIYIYIDYTKKVLGHFPHFV